MRALAVLALLGLLGCSAAPAPAPVPPPFGDLVFTSGSGNVAVSSRDGTTIALPAGVIRVALTSGGDVGEAYVVSSAPAGLHIDRLDPARRFATDGVADQPGGVLAAVELTPAPELTSFVGPKTVLAVLDRGGTLTGYQHGTRIWRSEATGLLALARTGDGLFGMTAAGWQRIAPENGGRTPLPPGCRPLLALPDLLLDCGSELRLTRGASVTTVGPRPSGRDGIEALAAGGSAWIYDGAMLLHLDSGGRQLAALPLAGASRLLASPDGSRLYFRRAGSIEVLQVGSLRTAALVAGAGGDIGLSRDGNYLYTLGGGRLSTYTSSSGAFRRSVPAAGDRIELVAGG